MSIKGQQHGYKLGVSVYLAKSIDINHDLLYNNQNWIVNLLSNLLTVKNTIILWHVDFDLGMLANNTLSGVVNICPAVNCSNGWAVHWVY